MKMPRFFSDNISESHAIITGQDAFHISKSLRMKIGDDITLCDTKGTDFFCKIESIGESVVCDVISSEKSISEPSVKVTLFQAVPKLDKLELIIQKCVELGVSEIVPVLTSRCISRPDKWKKNLSVIQKFVLRQQSSQAEELFLKFLR